MHCQRRIRLCAHDSVDLVSLQSQRIRSAASKLRFARSSLRGGQEPTLRSLQKEGFARRAHTELRRSRSCSSLRFFECIEPIISFSCCQGQSFEGGRGIELLQRLSVKGAHGETRGRLPCFLRFTSTNADRKMLARKHCSKSSFCRDAVRPISTAVACITGKLEEVSQEEMEEGVARCGSERSARIHEIVDSCLVTQSGAAPRPRHLSQYCRRASE